MMSNVEVFSTSTSMITREGVLAVFQYGIISDGQLRALELNVLMTLRLARIDVAGSTVINSGIPLGVAA